MDDLLSEFLTETAESLSVIDVELVEFEKNPDNRDILGNIFRLVHTIKGTCGFLGLPRLESVAHAGENVLGKFRDGTLEATPEAVTLILTCIDTIRDLLGELERTGEEPAGEDGALIARLDAMAAGKAAEPEPELELEPEPEPEPEPVPEPEPAPEPVPAAVPAAPAPRQAAARDAGKVPARKKASARKKVPARKEDAPPASRSSIRVNVDVLEDLMTQVSELVLTRNALLQTVGGVEEHELAVPLQRLSHITADLQEGVMRTRMQPIGNAWAKLPRLARDLSVGSGKKVELTTKGSETELDRQVLELIKDQLTHMVRNSIDHGLEDTAGRIAAGKAETGRIMLNAYHGGGHIIIEIADDGRGLDMDRIRRRCVDSGLATEFEMDTLPDRRVQRYIFKAGFSTAEEVTNVSGRGVGLDVVHTNIEKIGGTIDLETVRGKGTTFTIKIPLTLAIVSALIVECAERRFAIPQVSVLEVVRVSAKSEHHIETINRSPVLRLRDRLLPLVSLKDLLELDGGPEAADDTYIVVTQVGTNTFGILVDRVFDTEEIVVKPVSSVLRNIPSYSGSTILGDGGVIMILDPGGIAAAVGGTGDAEEPAEPAAVGYDDREGISLLVFHAGDREPKAVPLALVARLEEIDLADVEFIRGRAMVQYRGQLMPLIPFDDGFSFAGEGRQAVLVLTERERSMGLVVDEIVDIVEDRLNIDLAADRPGLIGCAVVAGRATDVIDAGHFLTRAFEDRSGAPASGAVDSGAAEGGAPQGGSPQGGSPMSRGGGRRVLLVDDSPFFRDLLSPLLSVAGWRVTAVESADAALRIRDQGVMFDAIVSDIEMPGMDGFAFATEVQADPRWSGTPLVALSASAHEADLVLGRGVGFSDCVAKFDRDALVDSLARTVATATRDGAGRAE